MEDWTNRPGWWRISKWSIYRGSHFSASPGMLTPGCWKRVDLQRNCDFHPARRTVDQIFTHAGPLRRTWQFTCPLQSGLWIWLKGCVSFTRGFLGELPGLCRHFLVLHWCNRQDQNLPTLNPRRVWPRTESTAGTKLFQAELN